MKHHDVSTMRTARRLGIAAALLALIPFPSGSPAPSVSASRAVETTVTLALVDVQTPVSIDADASTLADDVNHERAKRGRAPLARDAALDRFALAKATDMGVRSYFGHTSPDGVTFQARMRAARWPTAYVGENIAFDRTELAANQAFIDSPPHYGNVIDPLERRIGVAVVTFGIGETFYVEDFSG